MRGIDTKREIDPSKLLRDTRSLGERIRDFFSDPQNAAVVLVVLAGSAYFITEATVLIFVMGLLLFLYTVTRKQVLLFYPNQLSQK